MSKRDQIIQRIRVAGFHGDQRAFMRLYVENRIDIRVARAAYREGEWGKTNGVKCGCAECTK